ncbi:Zinc finger protein 106 [Anopheles sinensis]|uniref:Zinc finger protein 106 n=1 Tax=Anopheles sinensis TaxID=74873 RepID=A0A084W478_ANOSI|nr:Zinc finger protein 106 [Anopheles sinensis]
MTLPILIRLTPSRPRLPSPTPVALELPEWRLPIPPMSYDVDFGDHYFGIKINRNATSTTIGLPFGNSDEELRADLGHVGDV